jgi:hypothetical protein
LSRGYGLAKIDWHSSVYELKLLRTEEYTQFAKNGRNFKLKRLFLGGNTM